MFTYKLSFLRYHAYICANEKPVKVELVEISQYSGKKARFYSVIVDEDEDTLFEQFVAKYSQTNHEEIKNILLRLRAMNEETGIRTSFFKLNEGKPGDGVAAYCDLPGKNLRLYCILYGTAAVVFGGGGIKPKSIRTYQQSSLLNEQVQIIQRISKLMTENIRSKDVVLNDDGSITCDSIIEEYEND